MPPVHECLVLFEWQLSPKSEHRQDLSDSKQDSGMTPS